MNTLLSKCSDCAKICFSSPPLPLCQAPCETIPLDVLEKTRITLACTSKYLCLSETWLSRLAQRGNFKKKSTLWIQISVVFWKCADTTQIAARSHRRLYIFIAIHAHLQEHACHWHLLVVSRIGDQTAFACTGSIGFEAYSTCMYVQCPIARIWGQTFWDWPNYHHILYQGSWNCLDWSFQDPHCTINPGNFLILDIRRCSSYVRWHIVITPSSSTSVLTLFPLASLPNRAWLGYTRQYKFQEHPKNEISIHFIRDLHNIT